MLNPPAPDPPGPPDASGPPDSPGPTDAPDAPDDPGAETSPTIEDVRARVHGQLDDRGRTWLRDALAEAARAPGEAAWELYYASAGRHCGRTAASDVRVLLLHTAGADATTLTRLYRQGTAAERAAVLRALPHLPTGATTEALPLVEDALRANDTTLVAAAVGPYAAARLDPHGWRHAVLKCLFTGVPLDAVAGLARRARRDGELARMLGDFAHERTAAGRPVPADLHRALELTGHATGPTAPTGPPGPPAPAEAPTAPAETPDGPHAPDAPDALHVLDDAPADPPEEF